MEVAQTAAGSNCKEILTSSISVAFEPHPINHAGRIVGQLASEGGVPVVELLRRAGLDPNQTFYASLNDRLLTADEWETVCPSPGDVLSVKAAVHGGGGGSNPVKIVAMIAIAIVAPQIAGAMLGTEAAAVGLSAIGMSSQMFVTIAGAAISLAGNTLINALMPAPRASLSNSAAKFTSSPSPTYSLAGGSNRARPFEPLPLVLGVHRMFPDLAAKPFTRYVNQEQYLYMLFDFGFGDLKIEDLRIGETPIGNFTGVDVYRSGGAASGITQFQGNVDTADGAVLAYNTPVTRTSALNARRIEVDILTTAYDIDSQGNVSGMTLNVKAEYRKVGSGTWLNFWPGSTWVQSNYWSRGYTATERIETVDFDGNVTYSNGASVWHQVAHGTNVAGDHVENAAGANVTLPDGSTVATKWHWRPYSEIVDASDNFKEPAPPRTKVDGTPTLNFSNASLTPFRVTYGRDVDDGQYEIRLTNLTTAPTGTQQAAAATWQAIRTIQPVSADFSGRNLIGLRIKATAQLSGVVQQLSGLVSAKVDAYISGAWGKSYSRNPAWQLLALARGKKKSDYTGVATDTEQFWGAGLPDTRIDLASIMAWATWCESAQLYCSMVIDRPVSVAEALNTIARCGRATPTWANGKLGVIWDAASQPIVAVFGMSNIIRDTFSVHYISDKLTEEVVVQFVNAELGWQQDTVRALVPGVTNPTRTTTIELMGCTGKDQAGREANLIAAAQYYRRRTIAWESDFEGMVCQRGDVVLLSHDLTQWSYSGRLAPGTTASVLTLDREVPRNGSVEYVGIRKPDGTFAVVNVAAGTNGTTVTTLTLQSALGYNPSADPNGLPVWDYLWFFSPLATPGKKVKLTNIRPVSESRVQITATDEDDAYYAAEGGTYTYVTPISGTVPAPTIIGLMLAEAVVVIGSDWRSSVNVDWTGSNAVGAKMHYRINGGAWVEAGTFAARESYSIQPVKAGDGVEVEVTPVGAGGIAGTTVAKSLTVTGTPRNAPAPLAGVTATGDLLSIKLAWTYPAKTLGFAAVEVWAYTANSQGSSVKLADVAFPAIEWTHSGLAAGQSWWYWLRVRDSGDQTSTWLSATATVSSDPAKALALLAGSIGKTAMQAGLYEKIAGIDDLAAAIQESTLHIDRTFVGKVALDGRVAFAEQTLITQANDIATVASAQTTLSTTVDGHTTSLSQQLSSINGIKGLYTLKFDNNGNTSGFALISDLMGAGAVTSTAIFDVDQFAIIAPGRTYGSLDSVPFAVLTSTQTINGRSFPAGVYIDGGSINNATVEASTKIITGSVVTANIGVGEIGEFAYGTATDIDSNGAGVGLASIALAFNETAGLLQQVIWFSAKRTSGTGVVYIQPTSGGNGFATLHLTASNQTFCIVFLRAYSGAGNYSMSVDCSYGGGVNAQLTNIKQFFSLVKR